MSTHNHRDPRKERFWRRMLGQWRSSGRTIRAFCQLHDLSEPNFYAWRRILAQRDAKAVAFVPIQVVADEPPTTAGDQPTPGLELLLSGGRVLRIGPAFDAVTLQRLLPLLEEAHP
jgi:hypothetical protein